MHHFRYALAFRSSATVEAYYARSPLPFIFSTSCLVRVPGGVWPESQELATSTEGGPSLRGPLS